MNPRPLIFSFNPEDPTVECNELQAYVRSRQPAENKFVFSPDKKTLHYFIIAHINDQLGLGTFARCDIPAGTSIQYEGDIILITSSQSKIEEWFNQNTLNPLYQCTDYLWTTHDRTTKQYAIINGLYQGGVARFINHGSEKNTEVTYKDTQLIYTFPKGVKAGDQIVANYGREFFNRRTKSPLRAENSSQNTILPILTQALRQFKFIKPTEEIDALNTHDESRSYSSKTRQAQHSESASRMALIEKALALLYSQPQNKNTPTQPKPRNAMLFGMTDEEKTKMAIISLYSDNTQASIDIQLNKIKFQCEKTSQFKLVIAPSPQRNNEYCAFTEVDIAKDKPICTIAGNIVNETEIKTKKLEDKFIFNIDRKNYYCKHVGSESRFILNTSKDLANVELRMVKRIATLVAKREIKAGEELCLHYDNKLCPEPYSLQQMLIDFRATTNMTASRDKQENKSATPADQLKPKATPHATTPNSSHKILTTLTSIPEKKADAVLAPKITTHTIDNEELISGINMDSLEELLNPTSPNASLSIPMPLSTTTLLDSFGNFSSPKPLPLNNSNDDILTLKPQIDYKKTFDKFLPLLENGFEHLQTLQINKATYNFNEKKQKSIDAELNSKIDNNNKFIRSLLDITEVLYKFTQNLPTLESYQVEPSSKKQKTIPHPLENATTLPEAVIMEEVETIVNTLFLKVDEGVKLPENTSQYIALQNFIKPLNELSTKLSVLKTDLGLTPNSNLSNRQIRI